MVGTTCKQYRIDALLGRGGMGKVYRAQDTRLDRLVAIKVMNAGARRVGVPADSFLREARTASALNHPNIVTIHEIIETESGELLMVQEFVPGRTLRDFVNAPLPVERAVDIARQLIRAIGAAHKAGVVHRDIKPENVMVRPDGYVKVLDFGLAHRTVTDSLDTVATAEILQKITTEGPIVGTLAYMSPEQAAGQGITSATDVFSLGIVFYEMLTGRRPFEGAAAFSVLHAILSEHPAAPSRLNPEVPPALDALVLAMLAKEPSARPLTEGIEAELNTALGTTAFATPVPPILRHVVGRDREGARLVSLLPGVAAGCGIMAGVVGEAGMGKTSLVEEVLAELERGPYRPVIARGKCSERLAGAEAYLPILEILDQLLHTTTGGGFIEMMKHVAPTWYVQVAPLAPESSGSREITEDIKSTSQERMKRELAAYFQDVSRVRPLVLFLEDLHWADASTVDVLNYLAGRFNGMRVLVLVTFRPSDMAVARHPFLPVARQLQAANAFVECPLDYLDRADVERYLGLEFPGHALPPSFVTLIHEKTEGHPLFMVDLVRYLRDRGDLVRSGGRWNLMHTTADIARELPETVKGTIGRKIDRLEELDRRLLTVASVQGQEFDTVIVSDVLALDPADVEDRLAALDEIHRLVQPVRTYELPDRALSVRYRFAHVLYQNVLYGSLQPTRRASHAGKVARALVAHHGGDAPALAAELALLFETAREFSTSAQYFYAAAQQAMRIFGFREALSLAERGLAVLEAMPAGPARTQQELGLRMAKGAALRSTTGWATPDIEQTFDRARQLCHELGDPPPVVPVLWAITLFHLIRGNLLECRARADELMTLVQASETPHQRVAGYHMAGVVREFLGEMAEASVLLERARDLHHPAEHDVYLALYGTNPGLLARAMSSRPLWALGYPDRALARARETREMADAVREPMARAFARLVLHGVLAYRGDAAEAVIVGEENIALCREHGLPQEAEWSRSFQGSALISLGRFDDGLSLLRDSVAVQEQLKTHLARPMFLAVLADGLRQAERVDEGLAMVNQGFAFAARTAEGGYVAELHRVRGQLLQLRGDLAGAEASLCEALAYAGRQTAKSLELRAAVALASLLRETGRTGEGHAVLAPVHDWFTEGFATADFAAARTLLSEIG
jgi:hypothetical protein